MHLLSSYKGELSTSLAFSSVSLHSSRSLQPVASSRSSSSIMSSISWITSSAVFSGSCSWCSPPKISACISRSLATASSSELSSKSSSGVKSFWKNRKALVSSYLQEYPFFYYCLQRKSDSRCVIRKQNDQSNNLTNKVQHCTNDFIDNTRLQQC